MVGNRQLYSKRLGLLPCMPFNIYLILEIETDVIREGFKLRISKTDFCGNCGRMFSIFFLPISFDVTCNLICCFFSICCRYADRDQLQAIYSAYLQPVLSSSLKSHPVWGAVKNVHTLAGSMVAVYEQVLRVCSYGLCPTRCLTVIAL